jgi:Domain of unknown function (DUF1902)
VKNIIQFKISNNDGVYVAEGIDVAIVTEASNFDQLVKNISEAVTLHFEGEDAATFEFVSTKPSILLNYEIPQYA